MRVLFWGTPDFATPAHRALIGEGFDVVGVVTQPDRPKGRSRTTLLPPPVKAVAVEEDIQVLQPERPRGDEFVASIRALRPDISVVVAYGHILVRDVIELPRLGTLNIHASLLPALRGAAPVQAAIREGLTETGVTIMRMVEALDAGPIVLQRRTPIPPETTYGELLLDLSEIGAQALIEALALLETGAVDEVPQDHSAATYAPKVTRDAARISWSRTADEIARAIRAYDPKPGAWTMHRGIETRLFGGRAVPGRSGPAGEVLEIGKTGIVIGAGDDSVLAVVVQPSGKRRMSPSELAAGRQIAVGDVLT
jgi:methionyl-tRNA formyltransferase